MGETRLVIKHPECSINRQLWHTKPSRHAKMKRTSRTITTGHKLAQTYAAGMRNVHVHTSTKVVYISIANLTFQWCGWATYRITPIFPCPTIFLSFCTASCTQIWLITVYIFCFLAASINYYADEAKILRRRGQVRGEENSFAKCCALLTLVLHNWRDCVGARLADVEEDSNAMQCNAMLFATWKC